jgi:hypothetical protein
LPAEGLEVGVGPSLVVIDSGLAKNITTSSLTEEIQALVLKQQGLMAGAGLQSNGITKIKK